MTVRALPSPSSNPWLMPAAALAALALVVVAWLLPIGGLGEGGSGAKRPLPVAPQGPSTAELQGLPPYEIPDWTALEPKLMALRDPVEKPVESPEAVPVPGGETTVPVDKPTPPSPTFSVAWQYIGYIDDGTGLRAVVTTASMRQRLLKEGESVTDETDPRAQNIKVLSITPEELRLEQDGRELTLSMVTQSGTPDALTSPGSRSAPSRGGVQRPGVLPPQRTPPQRSREF